VASLVVRVHRRLFWRARRRSRWLLEGGHQSSFRGRSLDFDDLRAYVPGDDVKDIDWKGTARTGQVLVRRYVALRHHNIVFSVDCGRNMAALSGGGEAKQDLAVGLVGALGSIAVRQGDSVGLVAGDQAHYSFLPLKSSFAHLERMLQFIDSHTSLQSAPSDLYAQLLFVARTLRRRLLLVVVADEIALDAAFGQLLRRLAARHEIYWIWVTDADPTASDLTGRNVVEVADLSHVPAFLRDDPKLRREFAEAAQRGRDEAAATLRRLGIPAARVGRSDDILPALHTLLSRRRPAPRPGAAATRPLADGVPHA
jgi:uncharacterized protein (DUF58 family)